MFLEWLFLESSFPDEVTTPWRTLASSEDQRCILLSPQEGAPIISTDWGTQFNPISYPLSSGYNPYTFVSPTGQRMLFFNRNDSYQSGSSIYSHDYGSSWNPTISTVSSKYDINPELRFFGQGESCAVSADGSTVIVVFRDNREGNTNGHIWISRDYGVSFTDFAIINNGYHLSSKRISSCISANGQFQYISTSYNGIHRSVDGGQTWTRTYNRNSSPGVIQTSGDGSVVIEVNTLTRTGVLSSDYGSNWKSISIPNLPNTTAIAISLQGDIIYCSGYGSVYYSTDLGNNWLISSIVEGTPLAVQFGGICTSPSGTNLLTVQINQGLWKGYTVTVPEQKYDPPLELEEIYNRSWSNIRWARKGEKLTGVSSSFDVIELQQAPDVRMMFDVWTNTYVLADEISKVSLSGLQDVDLTGAQENSALVWNGSEWDTSFRIDDSVVDSATVWSSQRLNEIKLLDLANVIGPIEEGRVFVRHGFDWIEGFSLTDGTEDQDVVWSSEYFKVLVDALSMEDISDYSESYSDLTGYMTYSGDGIWLAQYPSNDFYLGWGIDKGVLGVKDISPYSEMGVLGVAHSASGRVVVSRRTNEAIYRSMDGGFSWDRLYYVDGFEVENVSPVFGGGVLHLDSFSGVTELVSFYTLWAGNYYQSNSYCRVVGSDLAPTNWTIYDITYNDGETVWPFTSLLNQCGWVFSRKHNSTMTFLASYGVHKLSTSWQRTGHGYVCMIPNTGGVLFYAVDKPRNWVQVEIDSSYSLGDERVYLVIMSHYLSPKNIDDFSEGTESDIRHVYIKGDGTIISQEIFDVEIKFFTTRKYIHLYLSVLGSDGVNIYHYVKGDLTPQYNIVGLSGFPSTPEFTHIHDYNITLEGYWNYVVAGRFYSYNSFSEVFFFAKKQSHITDYDVRYIHNDESRVYLIKGNYVDATYVVAGLGGNPNKIIRLFLAQTPVPSPMEKVFTSNISLKGSFIQGNTLLIVLDNGELHVSTDFLTWEIPYPSRNVEAAIPYLSGYLTYVNDYGLWKLYYNELPVATYPTESSLFYMDYTGRIIVSPKINGGYFEGVVFSNVYLRTVVEKMHGQALTNVTYHIGFLSGDGKSFYFGVSCTEGYYRCHYNMTDDEWQFHNIDHVMETICTDFSGEVVAYISNSTLFTSFNSGISWEESALPNVSHVDVSLDGKLLFAVSGLSPNRIAQVSADRGQTWNLLFDQEEAITITSFLNGFGILIKGITKHWFSFDFGSTWTEYGTSGLMILPSESGRKFLVLDSGTLSIYSGEVESNHQFQLDLDLVPTSDPGRPGVIWRDGTTLKVSV